MADTQETTADIIVAMRNYSNECNDGYHTDYGVVLEDMCNYADRLEAALKREKAAIEADALAVGGYVAATAEKSSAVDTKFELCHYPEQVLKIGRDFQNKDGFRGAHYDTVKLLCDTIEYQQEQLKAKTEVGNCAKLREALSDACYAMFNFLKDQNGGYEEMANALDKAKAALAAPARECDVGTPAEQTARFAEFCKSHRNSDLPKCAGCPLEDIPDGTGCAQAWAQMPYVDKEGGAK